MNDNNFLLSLSVVALSFFTVTLGSCQMTNTKLIAMVEAGASPLAATCALSPGVLGKDCAILAAAEAYNGS